MSASSARQRQRPTSSSGWRQQRPAFLQTRSVHHRGRSASAGHELTYHPGESNLRAADVVVINKVDTADLVNIALVRENTLQVNPTATIVEAASPIFVEDPAAIRGKHVLVVEDGPTLTHGGMAYGAGVVAAKRFGAAEIVDPRPYAVGSILNTYKKYPTTGQVLPAMGYGDQQMRELEETINATPCDMVIIATPIDLGRLLKIYRPYQRVNYELQVIGRPPWKRSCVSGFRLLSHSSIA